MIQKKVAMVQKRSAMPAAVIAGDQTLVKALSPAPEI